MDRELYLLLFAFAMAVIILAVFSIKLYKKYQKPKTIQFDVKAIADTFGKNNIRSISFIRNKINATVINVKKADMNALKEVGAIGINLVGNTVKCYFEGDNEVIYNALNQYLEELNNRN